MKILANGEIVPDDDPRVNSTTRQRNQHPQRGGIPPAGTNQYQQHGAAQHQGSSIFQTINQTLLGYGVPRLNVGDTAVEPVVSVGLVLAVVFFGLPGLLIGLLLFAASRWSTNGPPEFVGRFLGTQQPQQQQGRDHRNQRRAGSSDGGGSGAGHRLGRN